jgi:hypothetical protein
MENRVGPVVFGIRRKLVDLAQHFSELIGGTAGKGAKDPVFESVHRRSGG